MKKFNKTSRRETSELKFDLLKYVKYSYVRFHYPMPYCEGFDYEAYYGDDFWYGDDDECSQLSEQELEIILEYKCWKNIIELNSEKGTYYIHFDYDF